MLAADPELQPIAQLSTSISSDANQLTHTVAIDRDEGVDWQDSLRLIGAEEACRIVARNAEGGLRQIVGAEWEDLRGLRDLAGLETGARQLDHGAGLIVDLRTHLLCDGLRHRVDARLDQVELFARRDQRHHPLRDPRRACLLAGLDRGFEDRARLHLGDLRIRDRKTAAAKAEHRVELVKLSRALLELARIGLHRLRDLADFLFRMRQEFVQRGIEQPDRHRQALHDLEQLREVPTLHRQQLGERRAAALLVVGEDHLAHRTDAVAIEEHVLGAAEPDAFAAELQRNARVVRAVGVGALAGPFSFRTRSPQPISVATSSESAGSSIATEPASTWPVEPSMV